MIACSSRTTLACLLLLARASVISAEFPGCPIDGPLFLQPTSLAESDPVKAATQNLSALLDRAVVGVLEPGWAVQNTSFSIALISLNDPDPNHPAWEYHHRAVSNVNGTPVVDGDSQYLVGSISKMYSDLVLLKSGIDLDDPITKYLPELQNGTSPIHWGDITLASLADHLAGIPPNCGRLFNGCFRAKIGRCLVDGFSEYYHLLPLFESLGFPPLTPDDFAECGIIGLNRACTKERKCSCIPLRRMINLRT